MALEFGDLTLAFRLAAGSRPRHIGRIRAAEKYAAGSDCRRAIGGYLLLEFQPLEFDVLQVLLLLDDRLLVLDRQEPLILFRHVANGVAVLVELDRELRKYTGQRFRHAVEFVLLGASTIGLRREFVERLPQILGLVHLAA